MVIGIVGKSCSGKDVLAKVLSEKGYFIIDVDELGHEALTKNAERIAATFGKECVSGHEVNRKVLGPIVFADDEKLATLNAITHPWMVERVKALIAEHSDTVINAALLESMGMVPLCDEIVLVIAPLEARIARALTRDGITREGFLKRNSSQDGIGETLFSSGKSVITLINDKDLDSFYRQISHYCDILTKRGQHE